jgi:hypothetical protein
MTPKTKMKQLKKSCKTTFYQLFCDEKVPMLLTIVMIVEKWQAVRCGLETVLFRSRVQSLFLREKPLKVGLFLFQYFPSFIQSYIGSIPKPLEQQKLGINIS